MTRAAYNIFLILAVIWLMPTTSLTAQEPKAGGHKPNIIFILSDDVGIDGIGCYGSDEFKHHTPHIDALAHSGVRFEQCYSTPL